MAILWRPILLVALLLAVPIVPFALFGDRLEDAMTGWLERTQSPGRVSLAVAGILATDVFLPVPSSFVNTFAGAQLGVLLGTLAAWTGMTLGSLLGFGIARWCGPPLAARLVAADELARLERASDRFGPLLVVITRALPVLAEATVLYLGSTRLSWGRFMPAMAISNLGLAAVYATFGHFARQQGMVAVALAVSIALPLAAAAIARQALPARSVE